MEYAYDGRNNLTRLVETINGVQHITDYTYDYENRLTQTAYGSITESIEYDEYGRMDMTRVKNNNTSVLRSEFQYAYSSRTSSDTTRLSNLQVIGASGDTLKIYYSYTADGNIEWYDIYGANEYYGGALDTVAHTRLNQNFYYYDSANQLIREDNTFLNKTLVWTYDDGGNITSYQEYAFTIWWEEIVGEPTLTRTYTYGDSEWGDLLTAYNGVPWSYDGIGNLTSDGIWSYTWQNGRELAAMSNGTTTWNYTYDANGMRTSRTNGTDTYTYVYNGGQLVQMTKGNDTLYFTYGAIGPTTVTWNGTTYYYAVNAQGDVVGIFDGNGNCVVTYNWDNAWGYNPEPEGSLANTLGTLNPLRYRSYVYDEETGLYYLQSRYYNPEVCRFINADAFVATGQGMLGNNMFAYCLNNPVNFVDVSGDAAEALQWWTIGMSWLPFVDTVLPVGDIIYGAGLLIIGAAVYATSQESVPERSYAEPNVTYGPPSPNDNDDDDDDDYYDDDSNFGGRQKVGNNNGNAPGNNQAQNKQFRDATKGLTPEQRRIVHDKITGKGLGFREIKAVIEELFVW